MPYLAHDACDMKESVASAICVVSVGPMREEELYAVGVSLFDCFATLLFEVAVEVVHGLGGGEGLER